MTEELLARIEKLEARIKELEARPPVGDVHHHYHAAPVQTFPAVQPGHIPTTPWWYQPVITCGS